MAAEEILRLGERLAIGLEVGESHFREFKSALDRDQTGATTPREVKRICKDISARIPTLVSILLTIGWPRTPLFMRVGKHSRR